MMMSLSSAFEPQGRFSTYLALSPVINILLAIAVYIIVIIVILVICCIVACHGDVPMLCPGCIIGLGVDDLGILGIFFHLGDLVFQLMHYVIPCVVIPIEIPVELAKQFPCHFCGIAQYGILERFH